ncbi:hypothetical protein BCR33DRAFT_378341 [Rhizoclosmatium globosum]|uniref:Uncharacterized protein n=1 Tax=Rhizoclosmatium globosum TaxID=329046 RepID=A0A1Y2BYR9_9FUNG|nr:hypothetical protein BCR33DRAFT_378341 [Rhizoclosmatium globosum]|eukprot:ORY39918.1 hypothetical protein BCR33DRAFT_378341 [Rhizoclosmatium globosum]
MNGRERGQCVFKDSFFPDSVHGAIVRRLRLCLVPLSDAALYINLYRDLYEGFAVYSFFNLCLLYLGHTWDQQRESMRTSERGVGRKRCPPPLCCFTYDPKHPRFLVYCKLGICQLLVMRSLTCIGTLLLDYWNLFCPESMSPKFGHVYIVILNLASMGLSMFTLLSFYLASTMIYLLVDPSTSSSPSNSYYLFHTSNLSSSQSSSLWDTCKETGRNGRREKL